MHQAVEAVPALADIVEQLGDLRVIGDIAGENQLAAEFFGEFGETILEAIVLISERKTGTLAVACFGDAIGDGAVG
jgi:hypothetical protein